MGLFKVIFNPFGASRRLNDLSQEKETLQTDLSEAQGRIAALEERVTALTGQLEDAHAAVRELNDSLMKARREIELANFDKLHLDAARNELSRNLAERKNFLRRIQSLKEDLQELRARFKEVTRTEKATELNETFTREEHKQFPDFHPVTDTPSLPSEDEGNKSRKKDDTPTPVHPYLKPSLPFDTTDDDWLQELPKEQL